MMNLRTYRLDPGNHVCQCCRREYLRGTFGVSYAGAGDVLPCGCSSRYLATMVLTVPLWNIVKIDTWTGERSIVYGRSREPWSGSEREAHEEAMRLVSTQGGFHGRHRWSFGLQPVAPKKPVVPLEHPHLSAQRAR
jgi:hypothetical protein